MYLIRLDDASDHMNIERWARVEGMLDENGVINIVSGGAYLGDMIIEWRNSEAVRPYFIYQKPFTREGHLNWLKTMIDSGRGYQFIVCNIEDDQPIGCTYLRDYETEHHKIEYGMFLGTNLVKSKGIGTEIVALTLKFAFETLNVHKVMCRIFADNPASIKSCIKGGFEEEALLKDDVYVNGQYRDMVILRAINPAHK